MEYRFSEQQQMLKKALQSLLKKEMTLEHFKEIVEKNHGFSKDAWGKLADNGWLGILAQGKWQVFEDMTTLDLMYLSETFGERPFPGPYLLTAGFIVPLLSQLNLSSVQQQQLDLLLSGESLITTALPRLAKSKNGIDFNWPSIKIANRESSRIQLTGEIKHIPFIQHADYCLLPVSDSSGGVSLALLNTRLEGVTVSAEESVELAKPQGTIQLDHVWINKVDFIQGFDTDHQELLNEQVIQYLLCTNGEIIGGADEVLKRTIHYVTERKQFGVPVGSFQAVKHMISDMHIAIEKARSYSFYVAARQETNQDEYLLNVIASRYFSTEMYKKVCEAAIQLHGGMGFTWEESIHYWYKSSIYQLYHITHPSLMIEFVMQNLLSPSEKTQGITI
ncbi:acyl-CoA dehydrogenase family protein [Neobacillus rhizophilus]|uniref:Acyl-CoA dehydrogenase family protein n=1 Tax=Neobacillus rhizophilus TaxID=2833579 RepID=A0A942U9K8_9BACI|nr:acyl-CoA dehydrogenase family protein [Neobacillus rhizophilus]MBS4214901.1 acyl-CoA dehydrogenase family protein [Neobacillus rhizophilus]